jgi:uncharacterized protein (DUF1499 family)
MHGAMGWIVRGLALLAGALAVITPLFFIAAALGTKYGLWDWRTGFGTLTREIGPNLLWASVLVGAAALAGLILIALLARRDRPGAGGFIAAVAAISVGAAGLGYALHVRGQAAGVPPIHDIATNTVNPPEFSPAMIAARGPDANSVDYFSKTDPRSGRPLAEVQAEAYPDIRPIRLTADAETAHAAAVDVAREMGWTLAPEPANGAVFEATAETFWFGFRDDVVVRVGEEGEGSVVDARSVSRVGMSDLGANAARLREFERRLRERLGEPGTG